MPKYAIEISLIKIVEVEADSIDLAKEKVLEDYNDGLIDSWNFDVETKLYEEYEDHNPVITQEELDTCDGGIDA